MFIRLDVFTQRQSRGWSARQFYLEREMGDDSLQCVIPDEMCSTKFPSSMTVYTIFCFLHNQSIIHYTGDETLSHLETVIDDAHKKSALSETAVSRSLRNVLLLLGRRDRACTKSRLKRSARAQGATRQGVSRFAQWRPDALGMASSWWPAHPP